MGRVYRRGATWWVQYYVRGQLFRESARSALKSAAIGLLKVREGEGAHGRLPNLHAEHTTFSDLAALYLQDYEVNKKKSVVRARQLVAHLRRRFARLRATGITSQRIRDYIQHRQSAGAANGTINRELSALRRMFRLAANETPPLVDAVPQITLLEEQNVRTGFVTERDYHALSAGLPAHIQVPFVLAYWTGMRAGEILGLRWDQIDLDMGCVRLEPGTTKNSRARHIPFVTLTIDLLREWKSETLSRYPDCAWVCHFRGQRLRRIPLRTWRKVCAEVGVSGTVFHDTRRSGVRTLVRAGIPERVAMEISGHRTRSVFDRYNIVSGHDLQQAKRLLERVSTTVSTMGLRQRRDGTLSD